MELNPIVESLEHKTVLVTGSTGFLAKIFVEKLLRIQPNVKQLFLLLRAPDTASAYERLHNEVTGKELFRVLSTQYGVGFDSFISDKVTPIDGDIALENFGLEDMDLREKLWNEVDVIVNFAASTKFGERYDVALGVNTMGAKHISDFAKKCLKLEILLHISTAYVCGEKSGVILEKPLKMGETLTETSESLNIEAEVKLVEQKLKELKANNVSTREETDAMKRLGLQRARLFGWPNTYVFTKAMGEMVISHLRGNLPLVIIRPTVVTSTLREPFPGWVEGLRTIDSFIVGYCKGKLNCSYLGNADVILDLIPGDMVVNAILAAMGHGNHSSHTSTFIYQVGSSAGNPVNSIELKDYVYYYFSKNPWVGKDGKPVEVSNPHVYTTAASFRRHIYLRYMLPLKGLQLVNALFCQCFATTCRDAEKMMNLVMRMLELYEHYMLFKGTFDDLNTERLRMALRENKADANIFYFDPKSIDWHDYFMNIHIPGLVRYVIK